MAKTKESKDSKEDKPKAKRESSRAKETAAWEKFMDIVAEAMDDGLTAAERRKYGAKVMAACASWHELYAAREARAAERKAAKAAKAEAKSD